MVFIILRTALIFSKLSLYSKLTLLLFCAIDNSKSVPLWWEDWVLLTFMFCIKLSTNQSILDRFHRIKSVRRVRPMRNADIGERNRAIFYSPAGTPELFRKICEQTCWLAHVTKPDLNELVTCYLAYFITQFNLSSAACTKEWNSNVARFSTM